MTEETNDKPIDAIIPMLQRLQRSVAQQNRESVYLRQQMNQRFNEQANQLHAMAERKSADQLDASRLTEQINRLQADVDKLNERLDNQEGTS